VNPSVVALLVSHDGTRWLPAVIDGLAAQTCPVAGVVCVDTGSKDDSVDLLLDAFDEVATLPGRTSYPEAVRNGLEQVSADQAEWIWLLHDDSNPAPDALERLLAAAEAGGRDGTVLEILVLVALAHQAGGDVPAALVATRRAVALAQAEGYVRVFADEGTAVATLLKALLRRRPADPGAGYLRRLVAAASSGGHQPAASQGGLIEPLSDRELDVLRLLATELGGPEVARELHVALSTVRTHTKSIYAKLGVGSRRAAVRRATELDLLARHRSH